jgi:Tol biopolymer transport system component
MTASERLERTLPGILDDLSAGPSPDFLEDVFAKTARMRQRPGWTFPERWLPMADIARTRAYAPAPPWRLIAVALVVIAFVVAALLVAGSQRKVAPPFGPARNGEIVYDLTGDLYVGDPVTGESRLLVGDPGIDSAPSFSPDGTMVAFFRGVEGRPDSVDIYAVNSDGSNLRKVTPKPITRNTWANWMPDSRRLALIHVGAGPGQLELVDVDGKEAPIRPAPDLFVDSIAFRPPDGKELAVRAIVDGKYGVYAIKADGSGVPTPILEPNVPLDMDMHARDMVYSPDGELLFYQSYAGAGEGFSGGCCQLSVVNADGTDPHRFEGANPAAWTGVPSVSPDGRWVSYWSVLGNSRNLQVRVAPADGSGPSIATGPPMSDFYPWVWSPDSSKLLLFLDDGSSSTAYLLDPAGGSYSNVPWQSGPGLDWQRLAP